MTKSNETPQIIERLEARIDRLIKENEGDLHEMAERGKELVKFARIVRGCRDLIKDEVHKKLMEIVTGFENRCEKIRRKRGRKSRHENPKM